MSDFTGLGSVVGAAISGAFSLAGQREANAANAKMAYQQMAFQQAQYNESERFAAETRDYQANFNREMWDRNAQYNDLLVHNQELFQLRAAEDARRYTTEMQQRAMDYNTWTSSTAYQRGMADMKAAGLNPILAYGQGGATSPSVAGASTSAPSGAMGSTPGSGSVGVSGPSPMPGARAEIRDVLGPAIRSAFQGAMMIGEARKLDAAIRNVDNDSLVKQEEARLLAARRAESVSSTARNYSEHGVNQHRAALAGNQAISEAERPELLRRQQTLTTNQSEQSRAAASRDYAVGGSAMAQMHLTDVERANLERWGRSNLGGLGTTAEAIIQRGLGAILDLAR